MQNSPSAQLSDRFVRHPIGTEIGIGRTDAAELAVAEKSVVDCKEDLGELRENFLDQEEALRGASLGDVGELRVRYLEDEAFVRAKLVKARAHLAEVVVEVAEKHSVDLGPDSLEEWVYYPATKTFTKIGEQRDG